MTSGNKTRRGFFGIGVEGVSKPYNVGSLFRTANAFGAAFVFTAGAAYQTREGGKIDTSNASAHVPFFSFSGPEEMMLPEGSALVGIELTDDAVDLPSFRHPPRAVYVIGPERSSLSPAMQRQCAHMVKIPTRFALNLALAGALVMYDRVLSTGGFQPRPVRPGGPAEEKPEHRHGRPVFRTPEAMERYRRTLPEEELAVMNKRSGLEPDGDDGV